MRTVSTCRPKGHTYQHAQGSVRAQISPRCPESLWYHPAWQAHSSEGNSGGKGPQFAAPAMHLPACDVMPHCESRRLLKPSPPWRRAPPAAAPSLRVCREAIILCSEFYQQRGETERRNPIGRHFLGGGARRQQRQHLVQRLRVLGFRVLGHLLGGGPGRLQCLHLVQRQVHQPPRILGRAAEVDGHVAPHVACVTPRGRFDVASQVSTWPTAACSWVHAHVRILQPPRRYVCVSQMHMPRAHAVHALRQSRRATSSSCR